MKSSDLEKVVAERAAKRAFALVTNLKSGDQAILYAKENTDNFLFGSEIGLAAAAALDADESGIAEAGGGALLHPSP